MAGTGAAKTPIRHVTAVTRKYMYTDEQGTRGMALLEHRGAEMHVTDIL